MPRGANTDRFDAFVLCELARTDNHRFRVLEPDCDQTKALRALTRGREDLVHARVALSSQLRAELERFWPGPIGLFTKLDSPISLAFLERYPSPADVRGLGEQRLQAFLARQRYSGAKKPAELLSKLRRAPEGRVGEVELGTRRSLVLALVAAIKPLVEQIKQLDGQIATALHEHPDGEIFLSLFNDPHSVISAAELLAEIGDCRARYPTRDALAADAGQAAVAVESGKRKAASFRWGCNKRLRGAFCTLADSTRHWHPWAQDRYAAARARGHEHPRALRTLGRAWCRIVWHCWQDRPHTTRLATARLQQHIAVTIPTPSGPCPRPRCHPADGRRRSHRNGGPHGPSAKRLTTSRHPLSHWGVDVMKGRAAPAVRTPGAGRAAGSRPSAPNREVEDRADDGRAAGQFERRTDHE